MRKLAIMLMAALAMLNISAQEVVHLWPEGAPNSSGITEAETRNANNRIINVTDPTLTIYEPEEPSAITIITCPGGGYVHLAFEHEGTDMADWFTKQGVTYAVLKYRMPNGNIEVPLSDVLKAIEIMRQRGGKDMKVGVMGHSAGGNLASLAATRFTNNDNRPDFQILFYPVTLFDISKRGGHKDKKPHYISADDVKEDTPPAIIFCSADDKTVNPDNSIVYFQKLREKNIEASLHIYPSGAHGWGYRDSFIYKKEWTSELEKWLRNNIK